MSNRKHTLRTSAVALTGAAARGASTTAMTPAAQPKVAPKPLVAKAPPHNRLDSGDAQLLGI